MKKTYKLTLPKEKEVECVIARVENGQVVVDVEFKDKFQPKDGDFLTNKIGKVFIYNGLRGEYLQYGAYCGTTIKDVINVYEGKGVCDWAVKEGCRFATKKEISSFLSRLEKECGKKWNEEKKCLEDVFNPKDGDFLISKHGNIFIYSDKKPSSNLVYSSYCGVRRILKDIYLEFSDNWTLKEGCRFATTEEKSDFLERLEKECHKRWNSETKQLEDIKWRAKHGEKYYIVSGLCEIMSYKDYRSTTDNGLYKLGNYFRTPEAAQKVADQIKEIFKNYKSE